MDVFKEADVNADELIERYIEMYRAISQDDTDLAQEIDTQRTRRELAEKKKSKLLEYNVTGQITDADFLKMNRQCDNEIDECTLCLEELEAAGPPAPTSTHTSRKSAVFYRPLATMR